ncbi:hypothetical protein Tco_0638810, partial [Tanacetum coccineum]
KSTCGNEIGAGMGKSGGEGICGSGDDNGVSGDGEGKKSLDLFPRRK